VLLLAADGLTDKEIAIRLNLSQRTIGTYWERMREKLGHCSRTQLVARFFKNSTQGEDSNNYKNLFSMWEEGVWIILEDGTTVYSNNRLPDLFDLSPSAFAAASARELIEKATEISFDSLLDGIRSKDQQLEFCIKRENSTTVCLSMVASAVQSGKRNEGAIFLRLTDITVQRKVKAALDSCESSLTFMSDNSNDFIARFDSDLTCKSTNPSLRRLLDRDIVGCKILDLTQEFAPNELWAACLVESITSGETQHFKCHLPGRKESVQTHLLPIPTEDGKTVEVMSITPRPFVLK
jgi:PAS domain-containing protein